jgi:hypothetical protein
MKSKQQKHTYNIPVGKGKCPKCKMNVPKKILFRELKINIYCPKDGLIQQQI